MDITFHASDGPTLGIEMELSLVARDTRELAGSASDLLEELGRRHGGEHPRAKHELFECTVEAITGICPTVAAARSDLAGTIAEIRAAAEARDLGLISAGTHPFSHWHEQKVSPSPRYAELVEKIQWPARRLAIYGVHYHVGVRSGPRSIAIANSLTFYLPYFLALSASSPYWNANDTGLASCRTKIFEGLPTAGLPPRLADWVDFEEFMETLVAAKAIRTIREVWWDVRPHPDFGTVELRMCDAMPTLHEVTSVAALAQCLVVSLDERLDRDEPLPGARDWVVRENKWLAARHGVDAVLVADHRGGRRPVRDAVLELVDDLRGTARRLGCAAELDAVPEILEGGPSYLRQRRVVAGGGTLHDVVDSLQRELATDAPDA